MIYVGTLRDYGFTAEELPSLADYLDHPLVIHCGGHPDYYDRTQAYAQSTEKNSKREVLPANGGVAVSILGVPQDAADGEGQYQNNYLYWCDVLGTKMTLWDSSGVKTYVWFRK